MSQKESRHPLGESKLEKRFKDAESGRSSVRVGGRIIPFQDLVDLMNDAFVVVDEKEEITYVNRSFVELIGHPAGDIKGKSLKSFLPEEEWKKVKEIEEKRRRGVSSQYELAWLHWTGERVPTIVSATPILDWDGNYYGSYAVITDITGYRKAQKMIRESERRYKHLIDTMNEAVIQGDEEYVIEYVNDRFYEILGYQEEEVIGHHILEFVEPSQHEEVQEYIRRRRTGKIERFEVKMISMSGDTIHMLVTPRELRDEQGKFVGTFGVLTDITELKETERELRKTEKKYRTLAEESLQGLTIIQDKRYAYVNPAFGEIVGRAPEDIMNMPTEEAWDMIYSEDKAYILELAEKRERGEPTPSPYQYRFVRPNGEIRWVEAFSSQINYEGRTATQILVVDVTERKKAERQLRESQEMLKTILDNIPQNVFWKDRNGVYLGCNENFARAAGVASPQEIIGKTDHDLAWTREEVELFREVDKRVMETDSPEIGIIESAHFADGSERKLETNKVPLHDDEGNVVGILGTYQDVTDRWEKDKAIRKSEQKYRSLAEHSLQGLTILTDDGLAYVNSAFAEMVGYPVEDLLEMKLDEVWNLFHPDDQEVLKQRIEDRQAGRPIVPRYEYRLIHKDGSMRWVESFAGQIEYDGEPAIQTVLVDVTEKKDAERDIRSAESRADLYLDLMSHDIRNQMQVVMSSAALLRTATDDKIKDSLLEVIGESVQRCSRMIEDVRATEQLMGMPLTQRDFKESLSECVRALSGRISDVEFKAEYSVDEAPILADGYLELLITNILTNAVEHNPEPSKKVWVNLEKEGEEFVVSIADNGPGISASVKESLLNNARRFGGLGLHQANQIAEKYEGRIEVEDRVEGKPDEGARFLIRIPVLN